MFIVCSTFHCNSNNFRKRGDCLGFFIIRLTKTNLICRFNLEQNGQHTPPPSQYLAIINNLLTKKRVMHDIYSYRVTSPPLYFFIVFSFSNVSFEFPFAAVLLFSFYVISVLLHFNLMKKKRTFFSFNCFPSAILQKRFLKYDLKLIQLKAKEQLNGLFF